MQSIPGKFVWFEHFSNDIPRARAFYEGLFGWHTEAMPMGEQRYHLLMNGGDGIGGFRSAEAGAPSHWYAYLSVTDVDAVHAKALAAGAREQMKPSEMGAVGRCSGLLDPTGAAFALWKGAQGDRPDLERTPVGDWVWNELSTPDEAKALAFYEGVFGYTRRTMDMGEQGSYFILERDGRGRGGVMRAPDPYMPPMWTPYVHVADCDAAVAKATALGAQVMMPGTDIPEVGRIGMLRDPLGAAIALIKPAM